MRTFKERSPVTRGNTSTSALAKTQGTRESAHIQPLLLTRSQIGIALNMSEGNAKRVLEKHGIMPIDLGKGRGNGLRWLTAAVIKVADILHAEAQAKSSKKCQRIPSHTVVGKTAAQLFAEFNGRSRMNAEVCNGN